MEQLEVFNSFLESLEKTSPEHKDLLESVKQGVQLILESEQGQFASLMEKIPEFLKTTKIDEDPEILAARFSNRYADSAIDMLDEDAYTELLAEIEERIATILGGKNEETLAINEAEEGIQPIRKIRSVYERWDEESKEIGETDDKGWEDEEGVSMEPDEYDIDEGKSAIDLAVKYLTDNGPVETDMHGKVYRTIDPPMTRDKIERGIDEYITYFLDGFSDDELQEISNRV